MYHHILVPLDGSSRSECVLPHAIEFARVRNARVLLLHVIDGGQMEAVVAGPVVASSVPTSMILKERLEKERLNAKAYLERLKSRLEYKEGVNCVTLIDEGNPARRIAKAADRFWVDLVIMTSHRRSLLASLLHKELARDVLHRVDRPVLLVDPLAEKIQEEARFA